MYTLKLNTPITPTAKAIGVNPIILENADEILTLADSREVLQEPGFVVWLSPTGLTVKSRTDDVTLVVNRIVKPLLTALVKSGSKKFDLDSLTFSGEPIFECVPLSGAKTNWRDHGFRGKRDGDAIILTRGTFMQDEFFDDADEQAPVIQEREKVKKPKAKAKAKPLDDLDTEVAEVAPVKKRVAKPKVEAKPVAKPVVKKVVAKPVAKKPAAKTTNAAAIVDIQKTFRKAPKKGMRVIVKNDGEWFTGAITTVAREGGTVKVVLDNGTKGLEYPLSSRAKVYGVAKATVRKSAIPADKLDSFLAK